MIYKYEVDKKGVPVYFFIQQSHYLNWFLMAKKEPGPIKKKTTINHMMKIRNCGKKGK